jgi:hypothetical protein
LSLVAAVVGDLNDAENAWPQSLGLNGFTYSRATGATSPDGGLLNRPTAWYDDWLHRDAYTRQAYKQLEGALRGIGARGRADDVAVMGARRERAGASLPERIVGWLYWATVGYGYKPWRAVWPAAFLVITGALMDRRTNRDRHSAPSSVVLSTQRLIPLVTISEEYKNVDLTSKAVPTLVRRYFVLHVICGYVLAAFIVSAIARLTSTG